MGDFEELPLTLRDEARADADEGGGEEVAEVGVALAVPDGLEAALAVLERDAGPVAAATEAGWAGLAALRVATAEANGVPAAPMGRAANPRVATSAAQEGPGDTSSARAERLPAGEAVANHQERAVGLGGWTGAQDRAAGVARVTGPGRRAESSGGTGQERRDDRGVPRSGMRGAGGAARLRQAGAMAGAVGGDNAAAEGSAAPVVVAVAVAGDGETGAAPGGGGDERGGAWEVLDDAGPGSAAPVPARGPGASGLRADVSRLLAERALEQGGEPVMRGAAGVERINAASWMPGNQQGEDGVRGLENEAEGRSAVPPPAEREEGGGMGSVHLDGHLVGYWLSERMGRAASRPGAGTSFFDPRQAPAWTPSGVI